MMFIVEATSISVDIKPFWGGIFPEAVLSHANKLPPRFAEIPVNKTAWYDASFKLNYFLSKGRKNLDENAFLS